MKARPLRGGAPPPRTPDPARRVPFWAALLLLAVAAAVLLTAALLAGRVGPLVAHPSTATPTVRPPRPQSPMTLPPRPTAMAREHAEPSGQWLWWAAGAVGALLLILAVLWLLRALRRPARITASPAGAAAPAVLPPSLSRPADGGDVDATGDRTFDPQRAADYIIASWTAVEGAAARAGHRRPPASTPTEFIRDLAERLGGALPAEPGRSGGDEAPAVMLLRLYHRARFDIAALDPGAASDARVAARALLERIGSLPPAPSDPPGSGKHR